VTKILAENRLTQKYNFDLSKAERKFCFKHISLTSIFWKIYRKVSSASSLYINYSIIYEIICAVFVIIILGTGKSTPINYIKTAMCQLIELFPDIYNKKVNINNKVIKMTHDMVSNINDNNIQLDIINKKNSHPNDNIKKRCEERVSVIVNFDTELALFRQMSLVSMFLKCLHVKVS
jgi:hypothetical protein